MKIDYTLKFAPNGHDRLWGSESWEISAHAAGPSVIANGRLAGMRLSDVAGDFPLLIKVIDARERLSLQVHPNEHTASFTGGEPKTEMWCMLEPGVIYAGFKPGTDRAAAVAALAAGDVESILVRHECRKGDVFYIPGGLVHAIGGNVRLYEVQQSSDTTFRVYDWNRVGDDGRPRALHVRESLNTIDFSLPPPTAVRELDCPFFSFRQYRVDGTLNLAPEAAFAAVFAPEGEVSVNGEELLRGESALVPPGAECRIEGALQTVFVTRCR
jgi:mannose-6-phosphate isomerase